MMILFICSSGEQALWWPAARARWGRISSSSSCSRCRHGPASALYRWPQCHRKTEWQALLSKLTVACACTQRVVSPGVCHFYRTILSSIKKQTLFDFVTNIWLSPAFAVSAVAGISRSWYLQQQWQARCHTSQTIKISTRDNELNSSQKRYVRQAGAENGMRLQLKFRLSQPSLRSLYNITACGSCLSSLLLTLPDIFGAKQAIDLR